jgi:hypothetical protein
MVWWMIFAAFVLFAYFPSWASPVAMTGLWRRYCRIWRECALLMCFWCKLKYTCYSVYLCRKFLFLFADLVESKFCPTLPQFVCEFFLRHIPASDHNCMTLSTATSPPQPVVVTSEEADTTTGSIQNVRHNLIQHDPQYCEFFQLYSHLRVVVWSCGALRRLFFEIEA